MIRTRVAGLLVAATASTAVLTGGSAAAGPVRQPAPTLGTATTVTLVTGDVVTLGGPRGADVVAARGREHVGFRIRTDVDGDIHVVPDDAVALVSSGRLDPRLFDVTELARIGYGDADRKDVPLIVDYPGATPKAAGARAVRELRSVGAVAMLAEKGPSFWAAARTSASRIWLDGPVKPSLDQSVPQIGAPEAWAAGHTGAGATVAVLDTGIDTTHPDLDDAVTESRDFTGGESGTDDRVGHGTHVASIITGDGDRHRGVAPDAKLLNGKVLDEFGGLESWIIAGMEWAAASGADVINMSLGSDLPSDGTDPMSQAVNRLTAETGALFVASAGNSGPGAGTIGSPAAADAALTVGAVDKQDRLAERSSRGPRVGDGAIKPEITAPGVGIVAARAANGMIGTPAGDGYVSLSGTSMAAPHVAGAAAILAGQHPDWAADRLKSTLMSTAKANPDLSVFEQGAGRVDVAAASVGTAVSASPGSLSLGTVQWPHDDDQPIAKTITYTNPGTTPVTLDVAAAMTGPDGKPAPAGMFTVSPAQVTVPAGGTAAVTLTTDTRVDTADGLYSGTVVATGGDRTLRTPVSVHREIESYDVKLTFRDRDGNPTPLYGFWLVDHARPESYQGYDESGTVVMRLSKGTYYFQGVVLDGSGGPATDFSEPAIVVDAPAEYTFDARDGAALGFTVDRAEARPASAAVGYTITTAWGEVGSYNEYPTLDAVRSRPSQTQAPGTFEFTMETQLARPDNTGEGRGFHASPYLYNLRLVDDSRVPAELVRRVTDRQLAKVVSSHAVAAEGKIGVRDHFLTMPLPFTLTEYYSPGTEWYPNFNDAADAHEFPPSGVLNNAYGPRSYQLGRTVRERWNIGVFGPGFPYHPEDPVSHAARLGDEFLFAPPLFSDQHLDTQGSAGEVIGSTQLLRDGEVLVDYGAPGWIGGTMPPEEAVYTVRTTAERPPGSLSTRIDAEWTFRSVHSEAELPTPIPALTLRLAPNLDDHNAAPAGKRFSFPFHAQRNGAVRPGAVNTPTVEISYDDGTTWQRARVTGQHGKWQAQVDHPRNARFASVRWSVSDADGNTAKATIIHAYRLK
ncbi:S8 family serine peptidase [Actinophytocola sp.]|uniref:S8 family serine peptidase n=1 Tax=Actinophytocola sp. TaxID=1872138 RepID=UPI002ED47635